MRRVHRGVSCDITRFRRPEDDWLGPFYWPGRELATGPRKLQQTERGGKEMSSATWCASSGDALQENFERILAVDVQVLVDYVWEPLDGCS